MKGFPIIGVGVAAAVIANASASFAYPFQPDPASFARYLNSIKWDDGSRNYFQNLHNCMANTQEKTLADLARSWNNPLAETPTYESYLCLSGYVTITNPQGTKVCQLTGATWDSKSRRANFSYSACRYR